VHSRTTPPKHTNNTHNTERWAKQGGLLNQLHLAELDDYHIHLPAAVEEFVVRLGVGRWRGRGCRRRRGVFHTHHTQQHATTNTTTNRDKTNRSKSTGSSRAR
jgi:hypothetical protein